MLKTILGYLQSCFAPNVGVEFEDEEGDYVETRFVDMERTEDGVIILDEDGGKWKITLEKIG